MKRALLPSVFLLALVISACASSTPAASDGVSTASPPPSSSGSPSAPVEQTPSAAPSDAPPASPAPTAPAAQALVVDGIARTVVEGLRLRAEPSADAQVLGTLALSSNSYVVEGPTSADGYDWYLVSGLGLPQASGCAGPIVKDPFECPVWFGWVASAGPDGSAWLEPAQLDCPAWPESNMTEDFIFGQQRLGYLACFGDEERTVTAFFPEIPDDAGLGGACAGVPEELSWIGCNLGYLHVVPDDAGAYFDPGLIFTVDPASGLTLPDRGQWVELTGRYDHPAAQSCTYGDVPGESVMHCRAEFVVHAARAVTP